MISLIGFSQNDCENSILDELLQNSNVNQWFQIAISLNASELSFINECNEDENYTMFVPGNSVPNESTATLATLSGEIMDYIPYYIHLNAYSYSELIELNGTALEMMDGNLASINYYDGPFINEAMITIEDICACNGIIHVINDLIWAPGIYLDEEINNQGVLIDYNKDYIEISNIPNNGIVEIFNMEGKLIFYDQFYQQKNINTTDLKKGIHILKIQLENNNTTKLFYAD